jgi:hypothetical protein
MELREFLFGKPTFSPNLLSAGRKEAKDEFEFNN